MNETALQFFESLIMRIDKYPRFLLMLIIIFLSGCAHPSREVVGDYEKLHELEIQPSSVMEFKDCYLRGLDVVRAENHTRLGTREFKFSNFTRIEDELSVGAITSVDIYNDGKIEFYRWTNVYFSVEQEEKVLLRCYKLVEESS